MYQNAKNKGYKTKSKGGLPLVLIIGGVILALLLFGGCTVIVSQLLKPTPTPIPTLPAQTTIPSIATLLPPAATATGLVVDPLNEKTCYTLEAIWIYNQPSSTAIGIRQTDKTEALTVNGETALWYQIRFNNGLAYVEKANVNCP